MQATLQILQIFVCVSYKLKKSKINLKKIIQLFIDVYKCENSNDSIGKLLSISVSPQQTMTHQIIVKIRDHHKKEIIEEAGKLSEHQITF